MMSLPALCLDLFLLGHAHVAAGMAGQGLAFERRVREHLDGLGLPNASGFRVLGRRTVSGLYHQIDEQTACRGALVVAEWKAYRGAIPKNDLLRFKAATDDYWLASAERIAEPVVRIFGGTGAVTDAMRVYAAQWGIVLITPDHWPIPTICDPDLVWDGAGSCRPGSGEVRSMLSLVRPLNRLLEPQVDGSWRVPPLPGAAEVRMRLRLWQHWSERAWQWWDDEGRGRFDSLAAQRLLSTWISVA